MHLARTIQLLAIMAATTVASPIRMPPGTVIIPPPSPKRHRNSPGKQQVLPVGPVYGPDADSLPYIDAVEGALGAGSSDAE
ncbi:hypothetical protein B0A55_06073 [Friedmanniomyces simplex]|uniref:Uncharacterized protein n=1 Tax=Friedmanniomyces simplex TaxID=329884 RepID=A0A4U0XF86_9PEZI|nr:hypothetical protein B0A55_06073 [Friedmanniomyces simplex]